MKTHWEVGPRGLFEVPQFWDWKPLIWGMLGLLGIAVSLLLDDPIMLAISVAPTAHAVGRLDAISRINRWLVEVWRREYLR